MVATLIHPILRFPSFFILNETRRSSSVSSYCSLSPPDYIFCAPSYFCDLTDLCCPVPVSTARRVQRSAARGELLVPRNVICRGVGRVDPPFCRSTVRPCGRTLGLQIVF